MRYTTVDGMRLQRLQAADAGRGRRARWMVRLGAEALDLGYWRCGWRFHVCQMPLRWEADGHLAVAPCDLDSHPLTADLYGQAFPTRRQAIQALQAVLGLQQPPQRPSWQRPRISA